MLTIQQQMMKSLRQLHNYTNAGDLLKTLRPSIQASNTIYRTLILNEQQTTTNNEERKNQQKQLSIENETIINDSSKNETEKVAITNFLSQLNSHNCENENFSFISWTDVNGGFDLVSLNLVTVLSSINGNTQDSNECIKNTRILPTSFLKSSVFEATASTVFARQQRIHNFPVHRQQINFIHTQPNNNQTNSYAEQQQKQKEKHKILNRQQQQQQIHQQHQPQQQQTQFAMSSLAAAPATAATTAEPLSLKKDEIVTGSGQSGSDCLEGNIGDATKGKPCFNHGLGEILQFMELIGNLKHTKRTGWVLRDVNDCESISGHMYRMSMMTFLLDGSEGLNQIRCMELALVHDLAESLVGDITPFCGVSKTDKRAMEFKAMEDICKLIEPRGKRIMELFEEYEHGESAESKFVKDLDRLDMVMQAFEYEKRDDCLLKHQEFFDSTEGKFKHPFVKKLVAEIYEQRRDLAKAKGASPPPTIIVPNMDDETIKPSIPTTNNHSVEENATKARLDINTTSNSS